MSGNIWYETNYSIYLDDVKVKDTQENTWGLSTQLSGNKQFRRNFFVGREKLWKKKKK
ncbi:hypothetical protein IMAU80057_03053 [Lactiplantibacillus plantarum]|nr:hypothetical protein [Lactiplantibacillus plantarum]